MSNDYENKFRHDWRQLARELNLPPSVTADAERELMERYSGPNRHYHNLRHILAMLGACEKITARLDRPQAVRLAIFFHDAVYDPRRQDNEEQSALLLQERLGPHVDGETLEAACRMIRATKHHRMSPDHDTNVMLDLDMAILGQPWGVYERYAEGVRQEYAPVYGDEAYRQGRITHFLEPTIAKGTIFITQEFQPLNAQAMRNMRKEAAALKEGKTLADGRGNSL
jgi:predicted metal-dependent HD superfamily phosphohydrolase